MVSGRSETEVEYSVGFDANGIISALDCKAWCLAGAFMDLAWNDLYGVMTGLDQVSFFYMFLFFLYFYTSSSTFLCLQLLHFLLFLLHFLPVLPVLVLYFYTVLLFF